MDSIVRAKCPIKVPVVLTRDEVNVLLDYMKGTKWLMASLLYGAGQRLRECLKLLVMEFEFARFFTSAPFIQAQT